MFIVGLWFSVWRIRTQYYSSTDASNIHTILRSCLKIIIFYINTETLTHYSLTRVYFVHVRV